jgi:outer membrane protein OmpA-like peptidoglycan-associated protein
MAQEDDGIRAGLIAGMAVVALVVVGVVGGVVLRSLHSASASAPAAEPAAAAAPDVSAADKLLDELLVMPLAGQLVGRVYFASAEDDLPPDAGAVLDRALQALNAAPDKRIVLSGFHDASGDPEKNIALAKARALAVRKGLIERGADPQRIGLRKPEQTVVGDHPEEARRVELRLVETK